MDWWEVRQAAQPSHVAGLYNEEAKGGEQRQDPWETKRRYEEDLRKQMEMKRKREEEKRAKDKAEELKIERRIREQQERMKREYEQEIVRRREKEEKKKMMETNQNNKADESQQQKPNIPQSPPVPALRTERAKEKTQEEMDLIGKIDGKDFSSRSR